MFPVACDGRFSECLFALKVSAAKSVWFSNEQSLQAGRKGQDV